MANNILVFVDNVVTKEVTQYKYENCFVRQLKLVVSGKNNCSKLLHHIYQNSISQRLYDGGFERNVGLKYRCLEFMTLHMKVEECIEVDNIGNINDIIEQVSFDK